MSDKRVSVTYDNTVETTQEIALSAHRELQRSLVGEETPTFWWNIARASLTLSEKVYKGGGDVNALRKHLLDAAAAVLAILEGIDRD